MGHRTPCFINWVQRKLREILRKFCWDSIELSPWSRLGAPCPRYCCRWASPWTPCPGWCWAKWWWPWKSFSLQFSWFPEFVNGLVICDGKETGFLCFHSQFECTCVERKRVCVIRPFSLKADQRKLSSCNMQHMKDDKGYEIWRSYAHVLMKYVLKSIFPFLMLIFYPASTLMRAHRRRSNTERKVPRK